MYNVLLVIHTIIVVFLIVMVLIQRTEGDGMGGLGGGGGNQFLSGRTTANIMTRTTAILAAVFMLTSLTLAVMAGRMNGGSILDAVPVSQAAPVEPSKTEAAKDAAMPANDNAPAAATATAAQNQKSGEQKDKSAVKAVDKALAPVAASSVTKQAATSTKPAVKAPAVPKPE